jgi:5'-3' exonuclease
MGIPSYFVHIVKNHGNIIKKFRNTDIDIHNLYIDSNSIIYDAIKQIEYNTKDCNFEKKIIFWVCEKIVYYIDLIKPTKKVLIAFDGVAPVAKLEQQRNRRYKTWYTNDYISDEENKKDKWDTTAITPGTQFMDALYAGIKVYFDKIKDIDIMISGSKNCGEGEHKIYKYIRDNRRYHYDTNTIIYGLDADLIMLTLIHTEISENLYLFRETPYFITSIDRSLVPDEHYVLDIYELGLKLNEQMSADPNKNCIIDYIFLCFLLGNDFMPHFPALNIRTTGINILLETYHNLFKKETIINNNKINWKNLRKLIEELAKNEEKYCIDEMIQREKIEISFRNKKEFKTKEEELTLLPLYERKVENYINIGDEGWQARYYKELFGIEINDERRKQICINYLEGLEWNLKYYVKDCPDWKWCYKYKYPPLLEDLYKYIPHFDTEFIETKSAYPVDALVQLAYVLPRNSLHLLPHNIYEKLIIEHSNWYRLDYEILWVYCKYFWEGHVVLPHIDIDILEKLINKVLNE